MHEYPSARFGTGRRDWRGSHRGRGCVRLEPHGFELAKMYTRSLEDSQTHVRLLSLSLLIGPNRRPDAEGN